MKDELLSIANDALNAIDEFENYLFANHRAKYAMSKSILDQHREHITQIKKGLELDLDDAGFNDIRSDLNLIIDNVNSARNGSYELQEPTIDTSEVDQMLDSLKEERVETEYPTADINVNGINDAINTLEAAPVPEVNVAPTEVPPVPQIESAINVANQEVTMTTPEVNPMDSSETMAENIPQAMPEQSQFTEMAPQVDAIPQLDVNMVPQMDMNSDVDVNALDAFMNDQTQQ